MAENFVSFLKYSFENSKFDVSEHFLKNELILVLLLLRVTYENPIYEALENIL